MGGLLLLKSGFKSHCGIILLFTFSLEPKSSQCHHKLILIHKLTGKLASFREYLCMAFPLSLNCKRDCPITLSHDMNIGEWWRSLVRLFSFGMYSLLLGEKSATILDWSFSTIHPVLNRARIHA